VTRPATKNRVTAPEELHFLAYKLKLISVEIRHYVTASGGDPYQQWLDGLKDVKGRVIIQRRIDRVANGNFGDCRFCRDGVWELRIDYGPGYRVYYAREGETGVLLLCGGSKRSQSADIKEAARYWLDYRRRSNEENFKISAIA
jgi:putative addiction module killer protein